MQNLFTGRVFRRERGLHRARPHPPGVVRRRLPQDRGELPPAVHGRAEEGRDPAGVQGGHIPQGHQGLHDTGSEKKCFKFHVVA